MNDQQDYSDQQAYELFPHRRPAARPPSLRPGGRHRRDVPVSLPQDAPALVLAVPGSGTDLTAGPIGELLTILRVDNPSVDVRGALMDAPADDPAGVPAVLAAVAAARVGSAGPAAVVIPLIVAPHPPLVRRLRGPSPTAA